MNMRTVFFDILFLSFVVTPSAALAVDKDLPIDQIAQHGCQPNPFNPATQIHFDLTHSATVNLGIYSLDGRRLTTLADEIMSMGRHAIAWSGIDNTGRRVASGTYLVRLLVDGKQMVKRATLLK